MYAKIFYCVDETKRYSYLCCYLQNWVEDFGTNKHRYFHIYYSIVVLKVYLVVIRLNEIRLSTTMIKKILQNFLSVYFLFTVTALRSYGSLYRYLTSRLLKLSAPKRNLKCKLFVHTAFQNTHFTPPNAWEQAFCGCYLASTRFFCVIPASSFIGTWSLARWFCI